MRCYRANDGALKTKVVTSNTSFFGAAGTGATGAAVAVVDKAAAVIALNIIKKSRTIVLKI